MQTGISYRQYSIAVSIMLGVFLILLFLTYRTVRYVSRQAENKRMRLHAKRLARKLKTRAVPADDIVIGYRYAIIKSEYQGIVLQSLNRTFGSFGAQAYAVCKALRNHAAPDENCRCGFYSVNSLHELSKAAADLGILTNEYAACILQVRLSGQLYPGTIGQRAYRQDIERIWLNRRCGKCNKQAVGLALYGEWVLPVCIRHQEKYNAFVTIQELRENLQTEVEWEP